MENESDDKYTIPNIDKNTSETESNYENDIFYVPESGRSSTDKTHNQVEILSLNKDADIEETTNDLGNLAIPESVIEESVNEEEEDDENEESKDDWKRKDKHIFILSEAGKPIYTLNGNEVRLITLMGLMQALVSVVECDNNNKLKYIISGEHKFVFMHKDHLIYVNVSKEKNKCIEQLVLELNYIHAQIISVVTLSLIKKIFRTHHNYDLRSKLTGTEKLLNNIVLRLKNDYGMLLSCVNCYPLQYETREQTAKIIIQNISSFNYILFALLLFDNRVVAIIRPKKKQLHPTDIHLLINVITGLDTPKSSDFTCYPICLPNFDSSGIMYAYISYLDEKCRTCLILLTALCDHEQSVKLNDCRLRIQDKLHNQNLLNILNNYTQQNFNTDDTLKQINVGELRHFLYKDRKLFQYYVTDYTLPYSVSDQEKQRLFDLYQNFYHRLHNSTNLLRITFYRNNYETILGWLTSEFEIYVTFSPLITKEKALDTTNKILEFIKKNRTKLFITAMPTLPG